MIKQIVAERSLKEGFTESRLPEFTQSEIQHIKGTADFFGLNHYTTRYASTQNYNIKPEEPHWLYDTGARYWQDEEWVYSGSEWCRVSIVFCQYFLIFLDFLESTMGISKASQLD